MRKGTRHTKESKAKISGTLRGRMLDPEWIKRRTATRRKNHPVWHSEETIEKLRRAQTGLIHSTETKRKISLSIRATMGGLEAKARLAWSQRGRVVTEETREKLRYSMKRYNERKRAEKVKVSREITDNLSEIRDATRHRKERRRIEGDD